VPGGGVTTVLLAVFLAVCAVLALGGDRWLWSIVRGGKDEDRESLSAVQRLGRRVRRRVLWTFLAFGIGAASTWFYREEVFNWLLIPGGDALSPFDGRPVFTAPTDMMGATVHLAMRGGMFAALPVLTASAFTLIRPLLPPQQRRFITIFLPAFAVLYVGGVAFAYYVMAPVGLKFLLHFGDGVAVPLITLPQYLDILLTMMFWLGVVFELPLAMLLLSRMRVVSYRRFRSLRKFVPAFAFILGAIITPTFDVINQTMVAVPIILLFEVGLFLAWLARPRRGSAT
jgi:sec-independent protein translocase protein TatC